MWEHGARGAGRSTTVPPHQQGLHTTRSKAHVFYSDGNEPFEKLILFLPVIILIARCAVGLLQLAHLPFRGSMKAQDAEEIFGKGRRRVEAFTVPIHNAVFIQKALIVLDNWKLACLLSRCSHKGLGLGLSTPESVFSHISWQCWSWPRARASPGFNQIEITPPPHSSLFFHPVDAPSLHQSQDLPIPCPGGQRRSHCAHSSFFVLSTTPRQHQPPRHFCPLSSIRGAVPSQPPQTPPMSPSAASNLRPSQQFNLVARPARITDVMALSDSGARPTRTARPPLTPCSWTAQP